MKKSSAFDVKSFYPFGMGMKEREYTSSSGGYRFGFNGQEKNDEVNGTGNSMTAEFWQYDTRIGRRWNQDPKSNVSWSQYTVLRNNPIFLMDPLGDTTFVGSSGYILKKQMTDDNKSLLDNLVYMKTETGFKYLGDINQPVSDGGNEIDANDWMFNLLKENSKTAKVMGRDLQTDAGGISSLIQFKSKVKAGGEWDYKNRNESNGNFVQEHLLGLAFALGDNNTVFLFDGKKMTASDLNNMHFGVVGMAMGLTRRFLHLQAGKAEQKKQSQREEAKQAFNEEYRSWNTPQWLGDNPNDYLMIERGMNYFFKKTHELLK